MRKILIMICAAIALSASAQTEAQTTNTKKETHCKATKKDGTPCKSTIVMSNGYCKAHDPAAPKCGAKKTDGTPCKMSVEKAGDRCRFHIGKEGNK